MEWLDRLKKLKEEADKIKSEINEMEDEVDNFNYNIIGLSSFTCSTYDKRKAAYFKSIGGVFMSNSFCDFIGEDMTNILFEKIEEFYKETDANFEEWNDTIIEKYKRIAMLHDEIFKVLDDVFGSDFNWAPVEFMIRNKHKNMQCLDREDKIDAVIINKDWSIISQILKMAYGQKELINQL